MSASRWVLLQGKRSIHLCRSGKSPGGLCAEFPICGAAYGFPFDHSRYSGNKTVSDFPKCKKCLSMESLA